jgi:hypothetical protein
VTPIQVTKIVLLVVIVILILFDIAVILLYGRDSSISRVIYQASCEHPVIAFAAGFLCGHLFWRND